jgi:3-dehydroquinate synthase
MFKTYIEEKVVKNNLKESDFGGEIVRVELGERSYPVYVGTGTLGRVGEYLVLHSGRGKVVVITDENVEPLYGRAVLGSLSNCGIEGYITSVAAGEKSKRMEVVERLYDKMFEYCVERTDTIVALGGGVVGDLAGFVAATFKRGVNYVQVPTTLLAMVDSSIGGKTGINHPRGKNMIGSFYQPKMVFADTNTLETLPKRELGCGLAETVKHAVIKDGEFFDRLEADSGKVMELKQELMVKLVVRNCRIKAAVVSEDEREAGLRGILNYGHTIGHAIETVLKERDYHHGEAVALGMVGAARLAVKRKMLSQEDAQRMVRLLKAFNLPTEIEGEIPAEELYTAMKHDKKVQQGKIKFVLPTGLGSCEFVSDLTEEEIKEAMRELG